jgi:Tol biopolymer transport system component
MGAPRAIPNPDGIGYLSIPGWMPDGKQFVVAGRKGTEPSRGYLIDVATGSAKAFAAPGVAWSQFTGPPVSPDGRYVVLEDKDGTAKRWPVAGGDAISIPGLLPDELATTWSEDGAALYVAGRALPIPITRIELATGRRTPMMTMAPTDSAGLRYATATISPNGKYWAMGTAKMLSDLYIVEGLR